MHRLVAKSFIPNPSKKEEVNHIDGDRHNNKASNLEWATRKENEQHAVRMGLHSCKEAVAKTRKKVVATNINTKLSLLFNSLSEAGRELNVAIPNVCHCCRGRISSAGGYIFKYV